MKSDNISRQAAIDAVNKIEPVDTEYDCTLLDRIDVRYVLTELPSTDRKGHWKIYNHVDHMGRLTATKICVCDQCKEDVSLPWRAKIPNYCQNCGADMRGEQNDEVK